MTARADHLVLWDRHEKPRILPAAWATGAALFRGSAYGVDSWSDALGALIRHRRVYGTGPRTVQIWGHGNSAGPMLSGRVLTRSGVRDLDEVAGTRIEYLGFRMCDSANNQPLMTYMANTMNCAIGAHTVRTNPDFPWLTQRGFVVLMPGEIPTWSDRFDDDRAVISTLRMNFDARTASGRRGIEKGRVWTK